MAGAIVQSAIVNSTGALSLSLAFPVANTAHNAIAVFGADGFSGTATVTVTDTNNTYGANLNTINDTTDGNTGISNAVGNIAAGANTVKITTGATASLGLCIAEIAGVTASPIDGHAAQAQYGTNALTSGNATNAATAFGVGFTFQLGATQTPPTAGAGWTSSAGTNITVSSTSFASSTTGTGGCRLEWQASMAAGSNAAPFTGTGNSDYGTSIILFDESGAGPSTPHLLACAGAGV